MLTPGAVWIYVASIRDLDVDLQLLGFEGSFG